MTDKKNIADILNISKIIPEKVQILKPSFQTDGTITPANAIIRSRMTQRSTAS